MKNIKYKNILKEIQRTKALVIGDIILDEYFISKEDGKSPEANVQKYKVENHFYKIGGAGNVALNLKSLDVETYLMGQIGIDENGLILKKLLKKNKFDVLNIMTNKNFTTTTKTRIISKEKQIIRLDKENKKSFNKISFIKKFKQTIKEKKINLIILQDYNKGFLTKDKIIQIIKIAKEKNIFIAVDPKKDNFFSYKNVDLFKPNLNEINTSMKTQTRKSDINKLKQNINELKSKIKSDNIILTIGKNGILYTEEKKIKHSKAHKVKTLDPSGAGDVIISITSLLIRSGIKLEKVMKIANKCGSIVCENIGVYVLKKSDLNKAVKQL